MKRRMTVKQDRATLDSMYRINKHLSFKSKRADILSLYREKTKEERIEFMKMLDKEQRDQLIFELDIDLKQRQIRQLREGMQIKLKEQKRERRKRRQEQQEAERAAKEAAELAEQQRREEENAKMEAERRRKAALTKR